MGGKYPCSWLFFCDAFAYLCSRGQWKKAQNDHLVDSFLREKNKIVVMYTHLVIVESDMLLKHQGREKTKGIYTINIIVHESILDTLKHI